MLHAVVSCLDPSLLVAETHQPHPLQSPIICTPLAFTECPKKGDLVGIDAEFVTLNQVYSFIVCFIVLGVFCVRLLSRFLIVSFPAVILENSMREGGSLSLFLILMSTHDTH